MGTSQIFGLVIIVFAIAYLIIRRLRNQDLKTKKEHLEREKEKRQNTVKAIIGKSKSGSKLVDYGSYKLNGKEIVMTLITVGVFLFFVGYLFYDQLLISLLFSCLSVFFLKYRARQLKEKRKNELKLQFKEAAASLSSSLAAGKSIENAFRDTLKDLKMLYPDPQTHIINEFNIINRRLENGENIERALEDFAHRSDIDDIQNFSDVFITCKRTGGNLVDVIKRTVDIINEKVEIQQDIKILVSQKKLESRIIGFFPLLLIGALKMSSPDFIAPLYDFSSLGPIVMTVALVMIIIGMGVSTLIMRIEI